MDPSTLDMLTARELATALLCRPVASDEVRELAPMVRARLLALGDVATADMVSTWLTERRNEGECVS